MTLRTSPKFGGSGGGQATVTFPLQAPPSSTPNFAFTSGGGLRGTPSGGVALASQQGDALLVDPSGTISLAQGLTVAGSTTLAGGLSTTTLSASSLTTSGAASVGGSLGVAGSAQVDGDLTAQKITARAALGAASVSSTGPISGASLSIVGKATLGSLEVKGVFVASSIASDGPLLIPTTSASQPGLALNDQPTSGLFGAPGTLGLSLAGQTVASFAADTLSLPVALAAGQASFGQVTVAGALQVQGSSQLADLQANTLALGGDLSVQGTATLANLAIDHITTDHDLTVGGAATVQLGLLVAGLAQLPGGLSAQGPISLGDFSGGLALVGGLRVPGGDATNPPILQVPVPNSPSTQDYVVSLTADGALALSKTLYVQGSSHLEGGLQLGAALAGTTATFSGAGSFGADLATSGVLVGDSARLGGLALRAVSGIPEGQLAGQLGDQATDSQTGELYLKQSGDGSAQGWVKVATATSSLTFPLQAPNTQASQGPSFAFAASSGDGMGSGQRGSLYFTTLGQQALYIDSAQGVTLSGILNGPQASIVDLAAQDSFSCGGTADIAGALTADSATIATNLSADRLSVGTFMHAAQTTLDSLLVSGNATVNGLLAAQQDITTQQQLVGQAAVLSGAKFSAGNGPPADRVAGRSGDAYVDRGAGDLWLSTAPSPSTDGWVRVATSASGTSFPLLAPDGQAAQPSYGFNNQTGLTVVGGRLAAVVGGQPGWTLAGDLEFALAGALQVAGDAALQALTATQATFTGALQADSLAVAGASQLAGLAAGATTLDSLSVAAAAQVAGAGTFGGLLQGQGVRSGPSTWLAATQPPDSATGTAGDLASVSGGSTANPLLVRVGSAWRAVALVGDAAPASFPLRGPADSAAAPNFAPAASSPSSGVYSPGNNQLGFSTNGFSAGSVDAQQRWSLAGALSAPAATLGQLQVNGPATVTGATTLGGTLQASGAVTLASSLSAASLAASGALTAGTASVSGALSAQSASISGDATVGGNLTVNGNTTFAGVQKIGYVQVGDGSLSAPAVSYQSEPALGFYRSAAGVFAFVAGGAPTLTLAAGLVTAPGALRVGGTNAGLSSAGANSVALQVGGAAALTIASSQAASFSSTVGAATGSPSQAAYNLGNNSTYGLYGDNSSGSLRPAITVGGQAVATFFRGQAANNYAVFGLTIGNPNDPTPSATGGQGVIYGSSTPPSGQVGGTAGSLYCHWAGGGTTPALYVNEAQAGSASSTAWAKVITSTSVPPPAFPLLSTTNGSATQAVYSTSSASNSGLYFSATNFYPTITQAGVQTAQWAQFSLNSNAAYGMFFGPNSLAAGVISCASSPVGNYSGQPAMLYQQPGGGPGSSLWVNESTSAASSSAWAKVLTTSSPVAPTFPIAAPSGSASAPSYSFSASSASGFTYAVDAASGNIPAPSIVAGGKVVAYFTQGAANSIPIYNLNFGDPTVNSSPYNGLIRSSQQAASGNIIGAVGQLAINPSGGPGTVLAVKETGAGSTSGWSAIYTQGSAQLAGQNGSASAPLYSFLGAKSSGLYFDGSYPYLVHNGVNTLSWLTGAGGIAGYNALVFGTNNTPGVPYIVGVPSTAPNAGNPNANAVLAYQSALMLNAAGAAGDQLWIHEPTSSSSGWVRVVTENTNQSSLRILQGAAPAAATGVSRISATTGAVLQATHTTGTHQVLQRPSAATVTASVTLLATDNGRIYAANAGTGTTTFTLPATQAGLDQSFIFVNTNSNSLRVQAPAGVTIYVAGTGTSSAGGNITTSTLAGSVQLFNVGGNNFWFATNAPAGTFAFG